jgi:hypothetical protein
MIRGNRNTGCYIEIHIKLCRTPKIIKSVPKIKLGFSLNGKHLVAPVHCILLTLFLVLS